MCVRQHQHFKELIKKQRPGYNYTVQTLRSMLRPRPVMCTHLLPILRRFHIERIGLLLIDTEGFDCGIVASQNWSSPMLCALNPRVVIYETKWCSPAMRTRAAAAMRAHRHCARREGRDDVADQYREPYRRSEDRENVMWARGSYVGVA